MAIAAVGAMRGRRWLLFGASTANVWAEVATEAGVTVGTAARVLLEAATEL